MRLVFAIAMLVVAAGCTNTQKIVRPGGEVEYLIACGASTGWDVCYRKANELCPEGYNTVSEKGGFNRKEMRIHCPKPSQESQE